MSKNPVQIKESIMNKYTFGLIIIAAFTLALIGLIWAVSQGNTAAAFVLGIILALFLIVIGFTLYAIADSIQANREQRRFIANAKENMMYIGSTQTVMNQQNKLLLDQLKLQDRQVLPRAEPQINFDFDDAIFEELDSGEAEL